MLFEYKYLTIDNERVFLLGYEMRLTPNEKRIIAFVADGGATSSDLLAGIRHLRAVGIGNIAVHISSINKKAKAIGGRRLIVSKNKKYILNEFM